MGQNPPTHSAEEPQVPETSRELCKIKRTKAIPNYGWCNHPPNGRIRQSRTTDCVKDIHRLPRACLIDRDHRSLIGGTSSLAGLELSFRAIAAGSSESLLVRLPGRYTSPFIGGNCIHGTLRGKITPVDTSARICFWAELDSGAIGDHGSSGDALKSWLVWMRLGWASGSPMTDSGDSH